MKKTLYFLSMLALGMTLSTALISCNNDSGSSSKGSESEENLPPDKNSDPEFDKGYAPDKLDPGTIFQFQGGNSFNGILGWKIISASSLQLLLSNSKTSTAGHYEWARTGENTGELTFTIPGSFSVNKGEIIYNSEKNAKTNSSNFILSTPSGGTTKLGVILVISK